MYKTFGCRKAIDGDASQKIQGDLCGASLHEKGIARHKKRPCCINNRKIDNNDNDDNDIASTKVVVVIVLVLFEIIIYFVRI